MYSRTLYSWTLGVAILSCAAAIVLVLLPQIVPLPEPRGYAPYMFAYNMTYVFPLAFAVIFAVSLTLILLKAYHSRTRGNDDTRRKWKLAALILILLLPLYICCNFILSLMSVFVNR